MFLCTHAKNIFAHRTESRCPNLWGESNTQNDTEICYADTLLTEVLNWRPQNESKNNNFSNACISTVYKFVI